MDLLGDQLEEGHSLIEQSAMSRAHCAERWRRRRWALFARIRTRELWTERDASRLTLVYFVQREQSLHNIHHIERTFRLV